MMKRRIKLLIILISLIAVNSFSFLASSADNYATLQFERLELLEKGWAGAKFYFKINGTILTPDKKTHKIKSNFKSFDNLLFSFDSTFQNAQVCLTKFKPGQNYKIKINPCSQYELVANNNPRTGQVRFITVNNNDTLMTALNYSFTEDTLIGNDMTKYRQSQPSAMCYFAPVSIYFADKATNESVLDYSDKIKAKVSFLFLHGEKLTATYNGQTKKISLTLDGYMK